MFLTGDDPFHEITDRQHTHHGFTFHDLKMANAADGHNGHALIY